MRTLIDRARLLGAACLFVAAAVLAPVLPMLVATPAHAAGMSDVVENGLQGLFFNATTFDDIAENDSTSPATSLYLSLHTALPADSGDQTTSECAYTSYARVATTRNSSDWTVSGNTATLANNEPFPAATGSTCAVTHFCIVETASSTGAIYFCGGVTPTLNVADGVTPQLTTGTTVTLD